MSGTGAQTEVEPAHFGLLFNGHYLSVLEKKKLASGDYVVELFTLPCHDLRKLQESIPHIQYHGLCAMAIIPQKSIASSLGPDKDAQFIIPFKTFFSQHTGRVVPGLMIFPEDHGCILGINIIKLDKEPKHVLTSAFLIRSDAFPEKLAKQLPTNGLTTPSDCGTIPFRYEPIETKIGLSDPNQGIEQLQLYISKAIETREKDKEQENANENERVLGWCIRSIGLKVDKNVMPFSSDADSAQQKNQTS